MPKYFVRIMYIETKIKDVVLEGKTSKEAETEALRLLDLFPNKLFYDIMYP